jgi:glycosyltransferase involved in cell wall biosynthesis
LKQRVVYWNNIPSPYMVERFNRVAQRGNLEFEAWFSTRTEEGRSWVVDEASWEFRHHYLPGARRHLRNGVVLPPRLLRRAMPDVLVSLYASPAFLLGASFARARGARTAFWVEATGDAVSNRKPWKEAVKSKFLPRADGILTTGDDGRAFARRYAVSDERIFVVPHVVDVARYSLANRDPFERDRTRTEFGLVGVTFMYVGRLVLAKGLDHLLDAYRTLAQRTNTEVSLFIVGDGPDEMALRRKSEEAGLEGVVFAGFQDGSTLPRLYAAADVFVFPTLGDTFGMVVSEAMASGLSVIATSVSGEIQDRVTEGVNGFIVPPADSVSLRERMEVLTRDADLRRDMGRASRVKVQGQTPDLWAQAFETAIDRILGLPPARGKAAGRTKS